MCFHPQWMREDYKLTEKQTVGRYSVEVDPKKRIGMFVSTTNEQDGGVFYVMPRTNRVKSAFYTIPADAVMALERLGYEVPANLPQF